MTRPPENKISVFTSALTVICVLSVIIALSLFSHLKSKERKFNQDRTIFAEEKSLLEKRLASLAADLKDQSGVIVDIEAEKDAMSGEIAKLQVDAQKNTEKMRYLMKEGGTLRKIVDSVRKATPAQLMQEAMDREMNENVKMLISDTLAKINMVQLEPIVVTGGLGQLSWHRRNEGQIISINRKNSLIVVDIGRANGAMDGARLKIYNGGTEIASGVIIKTRYEISAAFIDSFLSKYTIEDVIEGSRVIIG